MVLREATVGPLLGTKRVSTAAIEIISMGRPRASAVIWLKAVSSPCPISVEEERMETRPSASPSRPTTDARYASPPPVKPQPCMITEKPTPFLTGSSPALWSANASRFS